MGVFSVFSHVSLHLQREHLQSIGTFGQCGHCICLLVGGFRMGFPGGSVVKNLPASAGATGDVGLILGQEDSLEEKMATCSSILAWKIPWTEEPGRL